MRSALLIACALFYAFLPAITNFRHAIFIALIPIALGLTYVRLGSAFMGRAAFPMAVWVRCGWKSCSVLVAEYQTRPNGADCRSGSLVFWRIGRLVRCVQLLEVV